MNISVRYEFFGKVRNFRTLRKNSRLYQKIHTLWFSYFTIKKFVLYWNIHTWLKISYFTKKFVHQMNRCYVWRIILDAWSIFETGCSHLNSCVDFARALQNTEKLHVLVFSRMGNDTLCNALVLRHWVKLMSREHDFVSRFSSLRPKKLGWGTVIPPLWWMGCFFLNMLNYRLGQPHIVTLKLITNILTQWSYDSRKDVHTKTTK